MLVHGVWLFALGNAFWRFDTYPARYYVSKLTNCKNLSKIGLLQIPFAEALKFVFDSLNCNTPLLHYFTETVRNCASNPPLSFPPSFCLSVTSLILGKGRGEALRVAPLVPVLYNVYCITASDSDEKFHISHCLSNVMSII